MPDFLVKPPETCLGYPKNSQTDDGFRVTKIDCAILARRASG